MGWGRNGLVWSGGLDGWWKGMNLTRLGTRRPVGTLRSIRRLWQEGNGHFWSWGISLSKKWEHQARANTTDITSIDIDGVHLPVMFLYILQYSASQQALFLFIFFTFSYLATFVFSVFDRHYTFCWISSALFIEVRGQSDTPFLTFVF